MIRRLVVLCAACVFPSAAPAAEQGQVPWRPDGVRAVLRAAPTRVTVGDPIPCAITITVPAGVQAVPPTPRELPGGIRVKFLGLDRTGGKNPPPGEFSYRYDLRIYETGEKRIPSVPVLLQGVAGRSATLDLGGLFFMVESVLDKDAKNI
ncbi:MAG: hypothetical protein NT045_00370, partial [Candidatus Aureabacteria bacterium]|nr:hypothetical protein [Candidatus Auribacterota bacterium]